ncbi:tail-specific protease precursor [gamma proteobacterium IMCC1989]|nr:tail-specific protease precursor [gamma proteobacterium IMCC1989]
MTPLKSQGELKITESKFYRVSGESTQHRGVLPDIAMPELIDPKEVGESSYDTALAWSKTKPVRHGTYFTLGSVIDLLDKNHKKRIASDPDFIYLNERKALLDEVSNREVISLNEKARIQEKEQIEQRSLSIENNRRRAKGLPTFENYDVFKEDDEAKSDARAANAGTTQIDTEEDALLKEAGYILKDFTAILRSSSKKVASTP